MAGDLNAWARRARRAAASRRPGRDATAPANDDGSREIGVVFRELIGSIALFDQSWVEAQLGRRFATVDDALEAYLGADDCSPHPLFLADYIGVGFGRPPAGRDALGWYLRRRGIHSKASPHPLVDLDVLRRRDEGLFDHRFGPVVAWLEQADDDSELPVPPGYRPTTLGELRTVSLTAAAEWRADHALRFAPRKTDAMPPEPVRPPVPARDLEASDAPRVSIVMPMWNRAATVRRAIESVQSQTFADWELIVVDDGSDDDGPAIVTGIAAFDARVVLVRADHGGVCKARNIGLGRARGELVAFLDTDNAWRRDFLTFMVDEMVTDSHPMAHAALRATQDGAEYYRAYEGTHDDLLVSNHVDLNVLVVRRDVLVEIGGFDETLRRGVDWDLVLRLAERHPLHLVPYVGVDYADEEDDGHPRISTTEPFEWLSVIASQHLSQVHAHPGRRRDDVVSVCLVDPASVRAVEPWLTSFAGRDDLDVVVGVVRLSRWRHVALAAMLHAAGNARMVRLQVDRGTAVTTNVTMAAAAGSRAVVVLQPTGLRVEAEIVDRLASSLSDTTAVAIPAIVDRGGLVEQAGATVAPGTPWPVPFLAGHPASDLDDLPEVVPLPQARGEIIAVDTDLVASVGGFDPLADAPLLEADLSMRIAEATSGVTALVPAARVHRRQDRAAAAPPVAGDHARFLDRWADLGRAGAPAQELSAAAWHSAGFTVDGYDYDTADQPVPAPNDHPVLVPRPRLRWTGRADRITEGVPCLRWTIDLASPPGPAGAWWGDVYFGHALADALRRRGQHVTVDDREQRHRASRGLDDVVLALRGLDPVRGRPGVINLEWIISHPDLVTRAEAASFDVVFAASHEWSARRAAEWSLAITPLLQATDPERFRPDPARFDTGDEVVFVGNSRKIYRSSLLHARTAGLPVAVYGSGWEDIIGEDSVTSTFIANDQLGALYGAAGLVLNDHWDDMRLSGFVSNRLMDAAASGARVASDALPGVDLDALFHGLVQTYEGAEGLKRLAEDRASIFPMGDQRLEAAQRVASEHSFDARSGTLLEAALAVRAARR
ncbi:glycosyltransferase [Nocardioides sp. C4-1]|uniref:glycosyltransferase n=1 Tax=Nocardioides sp. C4-1 TaxID=3151851 RepID=UPI003262D967